MLREFSDRVPDGQPGKRTPLLVVVALVPVIALAVGLSGIGQTGSPATAGADKAPAAATAKPPPRFDPAAVDAMRAQLLAEPKITDLTFNDATDSVTWQIGVAGDGSRRIGFAQYVCETLREKGLVDRHTNVRIVDQAELARTGGDFRAASLGHVSCADGADMGI